MEGAPKITDCLCDDCRAHYQTVKALLEGAGMAYEEDPTLVRGLDYYTRTVFEVQVVRRPGKPERHRRRRTLRQAGRRGGPAARRASGFALGYERCVLALQAAGVEFPQATRCEVFVACVDDSVRAQAFSLVQACRDAGLSADMDHQQRSLKSQFKLADKLGAALCGRTGPRRAGRRQRDPARHADPRRADGSPERRSPHGDRLTLLARMPAA